MDTLSLSAEIQYTTHARQRMAQRNLKPAEVQYILDHAVEYHCAGCRFYYLRECDLPAEDRRVSGLTRLIGTAVVVSEKYGMDVIITAWRNRQSGLRRIRRKARYTRHSRTRSILLFSAPFSCEVEHA